MHSSLSQYEPEMHESIEAEREDNEENEHSLTLYASLTDNWFIPTPITSKPPPECFKIRVSILSDFLSIGTGISNPNTFSRLTHSNSATNYSAFGLSTKQQHQKE